jgi:hypothetical protein
MKNIDELNNLGPSLTLDFHKIKVGDLLKLLVSGEDEEQMVIILKERADPPKNIYATGGYTLPCKNWKMFSWDVVGLDGRKWVMETTTIGKRPNALKLTHPEGELYGRTKLVSRPEKA